MTRADAVRAAFVAACFIGIAFALVACSSNNVLSDIAVCALHPAGCN